MLLVDAVDDSEVVLGDADSDADDVLEPLVLEDVALSISEDFVVEDSGVGEDFAVVLGGGGLVVVGGWYTGLLLGGGAGFVPT